MPMSKAEEVYLKTEELVASGETKAEAFKKLAADYGQPVNSIRGSYYSFTSEKSDGKSKPRRRETTLETAIAEARAALERSIANIDREVEAAAERERESKKEHEALKASAEERKALIAEQLDKLN